MFSNVCGMESVYQRVLGPEFGRLAPPLQHYFGPVPPGGVGRGEGVFEVAGSRWRFLRPVLHLFARRRVIFPEYDTDVPFDIENRYDGSDLVAVRRFRFPGIVREMHDRMSVRAGRLVDRLGARAGLEVTLDATVADGGMVLASSGLAWCAGRWRIPLPHVARVTVTERVCAGRQRVDVAVRVPVAGEVFGYGGSFVYRALARPEDVGGPP